MYLSQTVAEVRVSFSHFFLLWGQKLRVMHGFGPQCDYKMEMGQNGWGGGGPRFGPFLSKMPQVAFRCLAQKWESWLDQEEGSGHVSPPPTLVVGVTLNATVGYEKYGSMWSRLLS